MNTNAGKAGRSVSLPGGRQEIGKLDYKFLPVIFPFFPPYRPIINDNQKHRLKWFNYISLWVKYFV
jgi:hypothetical protein